MAAARLLTEYLRTYYFRNAYLLQLLFLQNQMKMFLCLIKYAIILDNCGKILKI